MSSKRNLYGVHMSPPVRAALLALEALNLDYNFKIVDIKGGELRSAAYLKKNPQHTVPTFEEADGKCVVDSHAIMAYLVNRYGKEDDPLYPKEAYARAIVDERLHYENGVFSNLVRKHLGPSLRTTPTPEQLIEILKAVDEVYEILEIFLSKTKYMAGDHLTIADFSLITNVTGIDAFVTLDKDKYPKLAAWCELMKQLPYYEKVNAEGLNELYGKIPKKLNELA